MPSPTCLCKECGSPLVAKLSTKAFCSPACRMRFNNRRRERGAELYDLFMVLRYQRNEAKRVEAWTKLCRMAESFRNRDMIERDGRQSWQDIGTVLADRPDLSAVKLGYVR